jgi:flagellar biosynthesis GTPase FlhF
MSTQLRQGQVRTYRGRSLEELIPRIRAELGPDAIILREREGLTGGVGGFFAQRCVEVDAQAPAGVDFYDEEEAAMPEFPADDEPYEMAATAEAPYASAAQSYAAPNEPELSFAERLARARQERAAIAPTPSPLPEPAPSARPTPDPFPPPAVVRAKLKVRAKTRRPMPIVPELSGAAPTPAPEPIAAPFAPEPEPAVPAASAHLDPAAAGAMARELIARGVSEAWAHELIVSAAAHMAPFAPDGRLRDAVRDAVASSLSTLPPLPSSGAAVAFVGAGGAGKTRCAAALAAAYARASTLRVSVLAAGADSAELERLLAGRDVPVSALVGAGAARAVAEGRERGLVVIDTDACSPSDEEGVSAVADELGELALDAVYLVVPATLSASAARQLLDGLMPIGLSALVISHADETDELGTVAELAFQSGLPVVFIHGGLALDGALVPAHPAHVAERLLP